MEINFKLDFKPRQKSTNKKIHCETPHSQPEFFHLSSFSQKFKQAELVSLMDV